jgi:hypothetical protein
MASSVPRGVRIAIEIVAAILAQSEVWLTIKRAGQILPVYTVLRIA